MTQGYPTLTISGDVDGDGSDETGVFEFKDSTAEPGIRTGALFQTGDGLIKTARSVLGGASRDDVKVDGGAGTFTFTVDFSTWEGEESGQWGNDSSRTLTEASATGQDPISQLSVFFRYLIEVEIDSRNPATLEWGEFSSSGLYSPIAVAPEDPSGTKARDETSTAEGQVTFISVVDLSDELNRVGSNF